MVHEREQEDNSIMRAEEVCKLLKIGRNTLYQWCEQKLIPYKRIGHLFFFSRKAIKDFIENNNEGGTE